MPVVFHNPGELDIRGLTVFGVSVKESDNPIGQFGTGLKYAIAVCLRHSCRVEIWSGSRHIKIDRRRDTMRGKEFEFITASIDQGDPFELGFTTDLGKHWQMWQAFRELHSNALDEGGVSTLCDEYIHGGLGTAVIVHGSAMETCWHERDKVFLRRNLVQDFEQIEVHEGSSQYVFFKGVRVMDLNQPSQFTYNFKHGLCLTEDRTALSPFQVGHSIMALIMRSDNRDLIRSVVETTYRNFEYHAPLYTASRSDEFASILGNAVKRNVVSRSDLIHLWNSIKPASPRTNTEISLLDRARFEKAVRFLETAGFDIRKYPIYFAISMQDGAILALADLAKKEIWLSKTLLEQGTKQTVAALLEEFIHLETGLHDFTTGFQNYLFDALITQIEMRTGKVL